MRKLIMSLASVAALAAAAPAFADDWGRGPYGGGPGYGYRPDVPVMMCGDGDGDERGDYSMDGGFGQRRLHFWIDRATRDGRLNWWEARRLHGRVNQIAGWEARVCASGDANPWMRNRVMQAYRDVARDIWREMHDHDGNRWGYERRW